MHLKTYQRMVVVCVAACGSRILYSSCKKERKKKVPEAQGGSRASPAAAPIPLPGLDSSPPVVVVCDKVVVWRAYTVSKKKISKVF